MLYRATIDLSNGVRNGEPFRVERLSDKARQILEAGGRIVQIHAPPIAAVAGWEERAARIERETGITMLDEFIEARLLPEYQPWQREALAVITPRNCKHCNDRR